MELVLLAIGKTSTPYIIKGIEEYCSRLMRYVDFSFICLPDVRASKSMPEAEQKTREGREILQFLKNSDYVALLDERGKEMTSKDFAFHLEKRMASGRKRLVFVVGGPYGFSAEAYARADEQLSLSRMTFSHEMVRLFMVEQIYRAMTILRGEPYHHE